MPKIFSNMLIPARVSGPIARIKIVKVIYPVTLIILWLVSSGPGFAQQATPSTTLTGIFVTIWGDPAPGSNLPGATSFSLVEDNGNTTPLLVDERLLQSAGGVINLNHQRVRVTASTAPAVAQPGLQTGLTVQSIQLAIPPGAPRPPAGLVSGSKPYLNILCMFSDKPAQPKTPAYFNGLLGESYPGLSNYWRELSYNLVNLQGSYTVTRWYVLPRPQTYYAPTPGSNQNANLYQLAVDCTNAANADVYFPNYYGINMMFNDVLDGYAWGGGYYLSLDGVSKFWPLTWMPTWGYADQDVLAHEMGHSFGLPHSDNSLGQVYRNYWDVMSSTPCYQRDATYGCPGQHTISYHKDMLGWIPPGKKFVYSGTGYQTLNLEKLAQPTVGNYLMVQIPINGSTTNFYTVEARASFGYDLNLPRASAGNLTNAVVIHRVDTTRLDPAWNVDALNSGNTLGPESSWLPGETFVDAVNNIKIRIDDYAPGGFTITINPPPPPVAPSNLTGSAVSSTQVQLSWNDNSNNEQSFRLERYDPSIAGWREIAILGPDVKTYLNNNLSPDTTYNYRVRAYNIGGYSAYSNTFTITTPPTEPSNLRLTSVSATQIGLAWNDNSTTESGFKIERKIGPVGTWTELLPYNAANVNTLTDSGLTAGTIYFYRVRAYNANGNSGYSNVVGALTLTTLQVTQNLDDGSPNTLSWAIDQANNGPVKIITFALTNGNTITFPANGSLPAVQSGVTIGGNCGANGPGIIIDGSAITGVTDGLTLNGTSTLYGVKVTHFKGRQIVTNGAGGNQLLCSAAAR